MKNLRNPRFFKKYIGIICKKIMTENNKQLTFLEEKGIIITKKIQDVIRRWGFGVPVVKSGELERMVI